MTIPPLRRPPAPWLLLLLLAPLLALPLRAGAAGCAAAPAPVVPAFETAQAQFLAGDFEDFLETATPLVPERDRDPETLIGPLARMMPQGFDRCTIVLHRIDAPGLHQQIAFFEVSGMNAPIALYLAGAEFGGAVQIVEFAYNSRLAVIMDMLR